MEKAPSPWFTTNKLSTLVTLAGLLMIQSTFTRGLAQGLDGRKDFDLSDGVRQTDVVLWQAPSVRWTDQGNIEAIFYLETRRGFSIYESKLKFNCLLYTSPSPRDKRQSRMPSSA